MAPLPLPLVPDVEFWFWDCAWGVACAWAFPEVDPFYASSFPFSMSTRTGKRSLTEI